MDEKDRKTSDPLLEIYFSVCKKSSMIMAECHSQGRKKNFYWHEFWTIDHIYEIMYNAYVEISENRNHLVESMGLKKHGKAEMDKEELIEFFLLFIPVCFINNTSKAANIVVISEYAPDKYDVRVNLKIPRCLNHCSLLRNLSSELEKMQRSYLLNPIPLEMRPEWVDTVPSPKSDYVHSEYIHY